MLTSWLKRSSLKRKNKQFGLLMASSGQPSMVMLLSIVGLFIALGIFVIGSSYAAGTFFNR